MEKIVVDCTSVPGNIVRSVTLNASFLGLGGVIDMKEIVPKKTKIARYDPQSIGVDILKKFIKNTDYYELFSDKYDTFVVHRHCDSTAYIMGLDSRNDNSWKIKLIAVVPEVKYSVSLKWAKYNHFSHIIKNIYRKIWGFDLVIKRMGWHSADIPAKIAESKAKPMYKYSLYDDIDLNEGPTLYGYEMKSSPNWFKIMNWGIKNNNMLIASVAEVVAMYLVGHRCEDMTIEAHNYYRDMTQMGEPNVTKEVSDILEAGSGDKLYSDDEVCLYFRKDSRNTFSDYRTWS